MERFGRCHCPSRQFMAKLRFHGGWYRRARSSDLPRSSGPRQRRVGALYDNVALVAKPANTPAASIVSAADQSISLMKQFAATEFYRYQFQREHCGHRHIDKYFTRPDTCLSATLDVWSRTLVDLSLAIHSGRWSAYFDTRTWARVASVDMPPSITSRGRESLHDTILATPAGLFRTAGDEHPGAAPA